MSVEKYPVLNVNLPCRTPMCGPTSHAIKQFLATFIRRLYKFADPVDFRLDLNRIFSTIDINMISFFLVADDDNRE